jgi:hypothetical protein
MAIRDFLRTYNIRMEFTTHSHPVTLCEGDEFLMDALPLRGNCSPSQLETLNACRMHLRVSRLSEIASADGGSLRRDPLAGRDAGIHLSATKWPRQARPLKADWNFWRKKLRLVFSVTEKFKLPTRLGAWKPSLDVSEWPALMSAQTVPRQAYHRLPNSQYECQDARTATSFGRLVLIPQSLLTHYLSTLCRPTWSSGKRTRVAHAVEYILAPGSPLLLVRRSRPAFPNLLLNSLTMFNVYYASVILLKRQRSR